MHKGEGDAVDRPSLGTRSCVKAMERKNVGHSERERGEIKGDVRS